ncbi:hypothetical protein BKA62DRAFT_709765 [Auriculariales sp. MPI-PUGE-AT-0066]|nr:hypothetical protein BKA62DRAFT_709765 [Auriculariales sp. MPI-PUGE-AT-0066]
MKFASIILFVVPRIATAAFSGDPQACWKRNCVVRNDAGTICLEADSNGSAALDCASPILQNITKVDHDSSIGRSIVYYDQAGSILGAATWPVPNPLTSPVYVCMTGTRLDDPSIQRTMSVSSSSHQHRNATRATVQ